VGLAAAVAVAVGWTGVARASPVSELRAGDSLWLQHASITYGGRTAEVDGLVVHKARGTLDFDVNLRDFGADYDLTVHVHGTGSAHSVVWTFDEALPSAVQVDVASWADHISGTIHAEVAPLPGFGAPTCGGAPCPYSVRVVEASESSMRVDGHDLISNWSNPATNRFQIYGGNPRPTVTGLVLEAPGTGTCSTTAPRAYRGRVLLSAAAAPGGSWIDVSTDHVAIAPQRLHVAEGARSGALSLRVPAAFSGTLLVEAASGGAVRSQSITVRPPATCYSIKPRWRLRDLRPQFPCVACVRHVQLDQRGDVLVDDEGTYLVSTGKSWQKVDALVGQPVTNVTLGRLGDLVGTLAMSKEAAFYLRHGVDWEKPVTIDKFFPTGVMAEGAVLGSVRTDKGAFPGVFHAGSVVPLKVAYPGAALAANNDVTLAGDVTANQRSRVFVARAGGVTLLPDNGWAQHVGGLNQAGDLGGWYADPKSGASAPFVWWAGAKVEPLPLPSGFAAAAVRAVADDRALLVRASNQQGSGALFVYRKGQGYLPVAGLVDAGGQKVTVDEVLGADEQLDLAVRGTLDGAPALFILWRE
jgi:hypothetical protein